MKIIEIKDGITERPYNINYVIFYESIYQCTPWMNSIKLMNNEGHKVKVFQKKYFGSKYNEECESINFEIINSFNPRIFYRLFLEIARMFKIFKKVHLEKISNIGNTINFIYTSLVFILTVFIKTKNLKTKEIFIAGDPISLIAAYLAIKNKKHVLVYWPLELWVYSDLKTTYLKVLKKIEKRLHKYTVATLEFGPLRRAILSKENNIPINSIYIIPNAPIGEPKIKRNNYFNELFGIPLEKKIILYAGGITDFNGIPQLIGGLPHMPENYVLVLHSKIEVKNKMLIKLKEKLKPYNAYISSKPLPFDKINLVYSSCDIGLMLMEPDNGDWDTNYQYADWSPGKMFNYLQFGVPVITTNLNGYKEFIEGNKIGKIVENINQVFIKAVEIMSEEIEYKNNCIKLFDELKFEKYHSVFYNEIINKNYN
jgi:glycosyltransferase involved in cell wall biosynthesis